MFSAGLARRALARAARQLSAEASADPLAGRWACQKQCGACCYLQPSQRPSLHEWLPEESRALYHSMVGTDGWCVHLDRASRACAHPGGYKRRPAFCRVDGAEWQARLGLAAADVAPAARAACRSAIGHVCGAASREMRTFDDAMASLDADGAAPRAELEGPGVGAGVEGPRAAHDPVSRIYR